MSLPVSIIRRLYPSPIPVQEENGNEPDTYCVGGALCLAHGETNAFPSEQQLACLFLQLNPALKENQAIADVLARLLIAANDRGQFEEAWDMANRALTYREGDT